ncbi:MAG: hypothetical protein AAFR90_03170 [Pseudomonadota bacterium]
MHQNEIKKSNKIQNLTRNQVLQYIAEMTEEMSKLAMKADCTDLAKSLKTAASEASLLLPNGYKD